MRKITIALMVLALVFCTNIFAQDLFKQAESMWEKRGEVFNQETLIADSANINEAISIYKKILAERDSGKAILLVSSELAEIMSLSDTIGVIYEGKIVGILDACSATETDLGLMMTGSLEVQSLREKT